MVQGYFFVGHDPVSFSGNFRENEDLFGKILVPTISQDLRYNCILMDSFNKVHEKESKTVFQYLPQSLPDSSPKHTPVRVTSAGVGWVQSVYWIVTACFSDPKTVSLEKAFLHFPYEPSGSPTTDQMH